MKNFFEFRKVIESSHDYFYLRNLDKARASAAEKAAKKLGVKYKKKPSTFYGEPIKGKVDLQLFGNKKLILKVLDKTPRHPDVVDLLKQFESLEEAKLEVTAWTGRKPPAGIKIVKSRSSSLGGKDVTFSGPENKLIAYAHKSLGVDKKVRKLADVQKEVK